MVHRETLQYRENMRGGRGTVTLHDALGAEDLAGHGRLLSRIVVPAGASIGWHVHEGETEAFFILRGEGEFISGDAEGERTTEHVVPGDVCTIDFGQGHSMENNSDEDLEFVALIYFEGYRKGE